MPFSGHEVKDYANLQSLIDAKTGGKGRDKRHYFYMIQLPRCGGSRIKIGKSSNIYARFKYYQDHFHTSNIPIHDLRWFPNQSADRWTEKGMKLYTLYEREVSHYLREFNKEKTRDGLGKLTEWYDYDVSSQLLAKYEKFPDEFETMQFDKTVKRQALRSKTPLNISDDEEEDEEEDDAPRRSSRQSRPIQRYNGRN